VVKLFNLGFLCLIHCVVLVIGSSRSQAINYGGASELYFSQHDVMRDLAQYLASQDSIVRRKRLLMPRKEDSLPRKWELFKDQTFDAQIVSIHTGG
jgi:hypothetical protein